MAFNQTNINEIKVYQLPQTVYDNMLAANEIDENGFYLTTGVEDGSNVVFEPSASSEGSSTTLGTLTINGVANELYVPASTDIQAVGEKTSSDVMPVFFGSSVLPNTSSSDGTTGISKLYYNSSVGVQPSSGVLYGAAWNDYAEYRKIDSDVIEAGRVVCETGEDSLAYASERLQAAPAVISNTYGMIIGERDEKSAPIAVAGKVLVYPHENPCFYNPGDVLCAASKGTASRMTREEIMKYPDRILGYFVGRPKEETFNGVSTYGKIWIRLK